jgi:hypothetical protein
MRFFKRRKRPAADSSLLEPRGRRSGAYTVEVPDVGAGHYLFDPSDSCSIHGNRLEAWCDVDDFATARDELHWHCMLLSQFGAEAEPIRQMADQLIESRQQKLAANSEQVLESKMATHEGEADSAPARVIGEREEREQAEERERELRKEAEQATSKIDGLHERFDELPTRFRVKIERKWLATATISLTVFDVGVLGNAFELLPGELVWKIILTIGVALAPLSVAIGIAKWISAAELPIREGVKATRLAMLAGFLCLIGIGLIVLFRMAASGTPPLPWNAYLFLAFIQSALAIAETMLYTVYFDSKVGQALLDRIRAAEEEAEAIDSRAVTEHRRATSAQSRIGTIEHQAAKARAELNRSEPELMKIRSGIQGEAGVLKGIVESAILEGVVAARRVKEREQREKRESEEAEEKELQPRLGWGIATLVGLSIFLLGLVVG